MCGCREQFQQVEQKHEQLLSDYHDLLVETDKRADQVCCNVHVLR